MSDNTLRILTGNEIASGAALILVAGLITAIIAFVGILGAAGRWPIVLGFVSLSLPPPPSLSLQRFLEYKIILCTHLVLRPLPTCSGLILLSYLYFLSPPLTVHWSYGDHYRPGDCCCHIRICLPRSSGKQAAFHSLSHSHVYISIPVPL